ncbi:fimbrial protein [Dyella telluris]|uniref:Type 1 fimbrial protein n=1 Tax=Dyella telluris TaxID=2763498 RepID=A0A7G8Q0V6_9GAMM|nr:fimbrial protein [Dyella telluris]QNK00414.1 type 1 fimbrial protein [Dyella telluris]
MRTLHKLGMRVLCVLGLLVIAGQALATCTGTTTTSPFTPAQVSINKNTPVGQVVSSATVTLTVTCNGSSAVGNGWAMNYTPQAPLQSGQMVLNAYGTSMAGLGYQMFGTGGVLISPTTYGTNGGDNFGPSGMGPKHLAGLNSTSTYQFSLNLVRTSTSLTAGTFSDSLVRFGYQDGNYGCGPSLGTCTSQFGNEITTPVVFHFVNPACTITTDTANQVVSLPKASTADFAAVGAIAKPTNFKISLQDCVTQTIVSMQLDGNTQLPTVLSNTGTARGMGVQLTRNGAPVSFGQVMTIGNVGNATTMDIPFTAQYYRTGAMSGGTVLSAATITMSYL